MYFNPIKKTGPAHTSVHSVSGGKSFKPSVPSGTPKKPETSSNVSKRPAPAPAHRPHPGGTPHFRPRIPRKWLRFLGVISITLVVSFSGYGITSVIAPELLSHAASTSMASVPESNLVLAPVLVQARQWVSEDFLTPNEYSRPQTPLVRVNAIVVHYVGNPNTTAQSNRNYFEQLATTQDAYASSHFVVGLEGEVIQCIPLNEIAYCSNDRNSDTVSIECCHPDASGEFNTMTYDSLVRLTAWLCQTYQLDPLTDVIRHYDVTGKACPLYYVENPDAWESFLRDVNNAVSQ